MYEIVYLFFEITERFVFRLYTLEIELKHSTSKHSFDGLKFLFFIVNMKLTFPDKDYF